MKTIVYNKYDNGVVSIGDEKATTGIVPPGSYSFANSKEEHIYILMGSAQINGQRYEVDQKCVVLVGKGVEIQTETGFAYRCEYR